MIGTLLLVSLFVLTLIALLLTGFVLSFYVSGRLITLLLTTNSLQQGAGQWYHEIKQHIIPSNTVISDQSSTSESPTVFKQEKTDDGVYIEPPQEKTD